jgi:hypothetical protein
MEKQPNSRMCFLCGIDNPIGLKLRFYTDDEGRCVARFPVPVRLRRGRRHRRHRTGRPKPEHQGYPGQLHGGIISTHLLGEMGPAGDVLGHASHCPRKLAPDVCIAFVDGSQQQLGGGTGVAGRWGHVAARLARGDDQCPADVGVDLALHQELWRLCCS